MKKRNIIIITTTTILLVLGLIITLSLVLTLNRYKTMDVKLNGEFETGKPIKILEDSFLEKHNVDKVKLNLEIDIKNTKIELSERIKNGLIPLEKVKREYKHNFIIENIKLTKNQENKTNKYHNYTFKPYYFYKLDKNKLFILNETTVIFKINFFLRDFENNKYFFNEKEDSNILFIEKEFKKTKIQKLIFDYEIIYSFHEYNSNTSYQEQYNYLIDKFKNLNSNKITYEEAYKNVQDFKNEYQSYKDFKKDYIIKTTFSNQINTVYYK